MFEVGDIVEVIGPDMWGADCCLFRPIMVVGRHDPDDKKAEYKCHYPEDSLDYGVWFPETSLKLVENA